MIGEFKSFGKVKRYSFVIISKFNGILYLKKSSDIFKYLQKFNDSF